MISFTKLKLRNQSCVFVITATVKQPRENTLLVSETIRNKSAIEFYHIKLYL